ncbi:MAG: AtpZ/AtpI family protein [Leptospirales bacterium]
MLSKEDKEEIEKRIENLKQNEERFKKSVSLDSKNDKESSMRHAGAGFEFIITFGVFLGGGMYLDHQFTASPWFLLGGVILGFSAGLMNLIRSIDTTDDKK